MKIGFQGRFLDLPFTGIGQYSRGLLDEFEKEFWNENLAGDAAVRNLRKNSDRLTGDEVVVCRPKNPIIGKALRRHIFEQHEAPKFFRQHPVDLLHVPYPGNPWRALKIPTVVTAHDVIPWIFPEYRTGIFSSLSASFAKRAIHLATHLITVSEFSKREIMRVCGVPAEKISVIYNGCSEIYSPLENSTADFADSGDAQILTETEFSKLFFHELKPFSYILYVGGYDCRKNVSRLLESFRLFAQQQKNAVLALVGRVPFSTPLYQKNSLDDLTFRHLNDTMEMADIGNGARVIRTDFLDEAVLATLYRHCRFFIHLSSYEGFNIPLLEAAKCGAPLLLSNTPVHHEIAGNAGIFVDQFDCVSVADGMKKIWNEGQFRKNLSEKSLDMAKNYSWKKSARAHLSLYGAICQSLPLSSPSWSSYP